MKLIVGLGNPGKSYELTRHNVGFEVVKALAKKKGWSFHRDAKIEGEIAQGSVGEQKWFLLLPETYMNSSGEAVRRCVEYFKVPLEEILVVCDDIALPFGTLRLREKGSAGGHNGLRSIEEHLGSQHYARLRIGVGDRMEGDLADHVLGKFLAEEQEKLPTLIADASASVEKWARRLQTRLPGKIDDLGPGCQGHLKRPGHSDEANLN